VSLFLVASSSLVAGRKGNSVIGERVSKAVNFDGRLWLLGSTLSEDRANGGLISLNLSNNSSEVHFNKDVIDIGVTDGSLWILQRSGDGTFVVSTLDGRKFREIARLNGLNDEQPIALINREGVVVLLSQSGINSLSREDGQWHFVKIQGKLRRGVQMAVASVANGRWIYLGYNMGEWGGGLQRVDLDTGVVSNIERRDKPGLCEGPLNSDCDPVTGLVVDSQNPGCVLASVGLSHIFMWQGRILQVCGETVTVVWSKPTTGGLDGKSDMTEPIFGLATASKGSFWAITPRALYRFSADRSFDKQYALPKLRSVSGIYLSTELPGAIVLRTDVSWAVSTSGYTPLIVPSD